MPKENRKRGRRAEKQRKLEHESEEPAEVSNKRAKYDDGDSEPQHIEAITENADFIPLEGQEQDHPGKINETPFYGMLDEQESEYFRKTSEMLEMNQFSGPEDRNDFIRSIHDQLDGKEMKLAFSQGTSRVLEKIIKVSNLDQLKKLFMVFVGHFIYAVQHRFASHCCETLFIKCAPLVTSEIMSKRIDGETSMEELYLSAASEFEENFGYLMTHVFATHPLRILLLVLAGKPIELGNGKSGLHSRKKEFITVNGAQLDSSLQSEREVPVSFRKKVEDFIRKAVSGEDATNILQSLSTHPTCSPSLQLLLRLETGQYGKQSSLILKALIPDEPLTAESKSSTYVKNLLFDPIGSRLLESLIEVGPSKLFKSIYKHFLKPRLDILAKNDVASYVLCTTMNRLGRDDLQLVLDTFVPQVPVLVERNKFNVIRILFERAIARGVETSQLEKSLEEIYAATNNDSEATLDMTRMLQLSDAKSSDSNLSGSREEPSSSIATARHGAAYHSAALVNAILSTQTPLSLSIISSLTRLSPQLMLFLATSPSSASALTSALTSPAATLPQRRKLVSALYSQISSLTLSPAGATVLLDGIWPGTRGLAHVRAHVAEELAGNERIVKASGSGRRVWRGWAIDAFERRRRDWERWSRGDGSDGFAEFQSGKEADTAEAAASNAPSRSFEATKERRRTALDRARERYMAEKARVYSALK